MRPHGCGDRMDWQWAATTPWAAAHERVVATIWTSATPVGGGDPMCCDHPIGCGHPSAATAWAPATTCAAVMAWNAGTPLSMSNPMCFGRPIELWTPDVGHPMHCGRTMGCDHMSCGHRMSCDDRMDGGHPTGRWRPHLLRPLHGLRPCHGLRPPHVVRPPRRVAVVAVHSTAAAHGVAAIHGMVAVHRLAAAHGDASGTPVDGPSRMLTIRAVVAPLGHWLGLPPWPMAVHSPA